MSPSASKTTYRVEYTVSCPNNDVQPGEYLVNAGTSSDDSPPTPLPAFSVTQPLAQTSD